MDWGDLNVEEEELPNIEKRYEDSDEGAAVEENVYLTPPQLSSDQDDVYKDNKKEESFDISDEEVLETEVEVNEDESVIVTKVTQGEGRVLRQEITWGTPGTHQFHNC